MKRSYMGLLALVASFSVSASEDGYWTSEFEFGGIVTTGNTQERNLKFKGKATRDSDSTKVKQAFNLDVLQSSKDDGKTARK